MSVAFNIAIKVVERVSKCIFALKPAGRKAADIERTLYKWLDPLPKNLFKSIIFDCGKEFSNWKNTADSFSSTKTKMN